MDVDGLQQGLRTKRFGRSLVFMREVSSTNDLAKELAGYGAIEGTVVFAETQTAGRGRLSREWVSPRGGLWFSVILRPKFRASEAARLVFVAGLAVAEVLHEKYGLKVETKWPNDVLVNGKKICGILTEMKTKGETVNFVVVGVGVNANLVRETFPEPLREVVTSLENELGHSVRLEELFSALLENLEIKYDLFTEGNYIRILDSWKSYATFLGQKVEVTSGDESFVGLAMNVGYDGALVLKFDDGTVRRVLVGDVYVQAN
jgi:biotin-[acetyl-CoA-carboxylase] ligase BirA-like protein